MTEYIAKPQTPKNMQTKCNEMYRMFRTEQVFTKQQFSKHFNVSERTAREMVSTVAKSHPIIATSDKRGYRLARRMSDYEDAQHQLAEINSRIKELQSRKKPLERFCELVEEKRRNT